MVRGLHDWRAKWRAAVLLGLRLPAVGRTILGGHGRDETRLNAAPTAGGHYPVANSKE
jgi:hypothetical protein